MDFTPIGPIVILLGLFAFMIKAQRPGIFLNAIGNFICFWTAESIGLKIFYMAFFILAVGCDISIQEMKRRIAIEKFNQNKSNKDNK